MAYPHSKGTARAVKAKHPVAGVALDKGVVSSLITKYKGNVSMVADAMGSCRGSVSRMIHNHPELVEQLKQARERQLDQLEQTVFDRAIDEKDTTLQLFLLKTQGKSRGYDQDEAKNHAKDIATAAFEFIISKSNT